MSRLHTAVGALLSSKKRTSSRKKQKGILSYSHLSVRVGEDLRGGSVPYDSAVGRARGRARALTGEGALSGADG